MYRNYNKANAFLIHYILFRESVQFYQIVKKIIVDIFLLIFEDLAPFSLILLLFDLNVL